MEFWKYNSNYFLSIIKIVGIEISDWNCFQLQIEIFSNIQKIKEVDIWKRFPNGIRGKMIIENIWLTNIDRENGEVV